MNMDMYHYAGLNPVKLVDPDGNYEKDVHFDLTYFLGIKAGLDSKTAYEIAQANQNVDDSSKTGPMPWQGGEKACRGYHFCTPERLAELKLQAENGGNNAKGTYLHAIQDSKYAHKPYIKNAHHIKDGRAPDKTYNDPKKAMKMALDTFETIKALTGTKGKLSAKDYEAIEAFNRATNESDKIKILENALGGKIPEYKKPKEKRE
ncbi:MAG: hypothetical protein N3D75_04750 [Candidatus Aenigmarchaeota archaeon]|nr:hypothetical protein [Candidatus Aenigmarchaeota archaeon]